MNGTSGQRQGRRRAKKVLLIEANEIMWPMIDRQTARGKLPNFARLRRQGAVASPRSVDLPPHLDPWVTWVTVHSGVPRDKHGATVLEQGADTIAAPRLWDYADQAGLSVGVFGSISCYPPRHVRGFMVPGPFAPGPETYPAELQPVQQLNQKYTQVHNKLASEDTPLDMVKQGVQLIRLGLKPQTMVRIAAQLGLERVRDHLHWRRVSLQPYVNYDFFERLYRRHRPDFATWHTNHCAHYQHHYWRAFDDGAFLRPADEDEKRKYGGAIDYGYRVLDELLGRFSALVDDDTVLVVASSMGQKPYVTEQYKGGRWIVRFSDIDRLLDIVGREGVTERFAVMAPEWNLVVPDEAQRRRLIELFRSAYREAPGETREALAVTETGEVLTVNPKGLAEPDASIRYFFPGAPGAREEGYAYDELFVHDAPTPKEGMHHPVGMLLLWGAGIEAGVEISDTTNLDIAPTLLSLMGIDVPEHLPGRVLSEAWGSPPQSAGAARPAHLAAS